VPVSLPVPSFEVREPVSDEVREPVSDEVREPVTGEVLVPPSGEVPSGGGPPSEAVPVVELQDVSWGAARFGFRCRVAMFPSLIERAEPAGVFSPSLPRHRLSSGSAATECPAVCRHARPAAVPSRGHAATL